MEPICMVGLTIAGTASTTPVNKPTSSLRIRECISWIEYLNCSCVTKNIQKRDNFNLDLNAQSRISLKQEIGNDMIELWWSKGIWAECLNCRRAEHISRLLTFTWYFTTWISFTTHHSHSSHPHHFTSRYSRIKLDLFSFPTFTWGLATSSSSSPQKSLSMFNFPVCTYNFDKSILCLNSFAFPSPFLSLITQRNINPIWWLCWHI